MRPGRKIGTRTGGYRERPRMAVVMWVAAVPGGAAAGGEAVAEAARGAAGGAVAEAAGEAAGRAVAEAAGGAAAEAAEEARIMSANA